VKDSDCSTNKLETPAAQPCTIIHDLRAPLINAMGYLSELKLFKVKLLADLASQANEEPQTLSLQDIASEVDSEMTLCIDVINTSLVQLEKQIMDLSEHL